jgi:branched-chain amino acid transport system ATP-binding protein
MALLEVKGITKVFGGLSALSQVDLEVNAGEIVGVIGPNGAGKTTLFNVISGFHRPSSGTVRFRERDITGLRPDQIVRRGLVRTFQSTTLFHDFTVLQNVLIGHHLRAGTGAWPGFFNDVLSEKERKKALEPSRDLIDFVGLTGLEDELAMNLPHGHQRALGLAVALAVRPELVMLDEPVTGMILEEMHRMMDMIRKVRDKGVTVLLVEHHMRMVMGVCERVIVLNYGTKIAEGKPEEIQKNAEVVEVYLGRSYLGSDIPTASLD